MKSIAFQHFPRLVQQGTEKRLFNPILKKRFKIRPEERVRLKWTEYLIHQTGWKKSRIGFEAPVKLRQESHSVRADLVLYSKEMKPEVLVECKAENIPLTTATAAQAARYNTKLEARFICLTNGISDFWFETDGKSVEEAGSPIRETLAFDQIRKDRSWWSERGFCAGQSTGGQHDQLPELLNRFWYTESEGMWNYLDFESGPLPFSMSHYYRIFKIGNRSRLAMTFLGSPEGEDLLMAVLNKSGRNQGILKVNLSEMVQNLPEPVSIYTSSGVKTTDAVRLIDYFDSPGNNPGLINLPETVMNFFD